jgi:hypothetical protein
VKDWRNFTKISNLAWRRGPLTPWRPPARARHPGLRSFSRVGRLRCDASDLRRGTHPPKTVDNIRRPEAPPHPEKCTPLRRRGGPTQLKNCTTCGRQRNPRRYASTVNLIRKRTAVKFDRGPQIDARIDSDRGSRRIEARGTAVLNLVMLPYLPKNLNFVFLKIIAVNNKRAYFWKIT